jgi:peptidoglycan/LPS O-acetylase OafA/YrhL
MHQQSEVSTLNQRAGPPSPTDRQNIPFIALLRAIACLLVVWCHLVSGWVASHGLQFSPLDVTHAYVTQPLVIIQDFGFLGVAMFFLVSGFIITHVAQRESQVAFLIKRALRIYPPLILSIIVIAVLFKLLGATHTGATGEIGAMMADPAQPRRFLNFVLAATLLNYFWSDNRWINPVAWTLIIEILFYAMTLIVMPVMKWSATLATLLLTAVCWVVVLRSHDLGDNFGAFSVSMGLIPLLLIGQCTCWIWSGRIGFRRFALLLAANWFVFADALGAIYVDKLPAATSYGVSVLYACLIFVILMLINERLRLPKILNFYAKISYSLYLLHEPLGEALLGTLSPKLGYGWSIAITFLLVTLLSYLAWLWVEQPSQTAAKGLLKYLKAKPVSGPLHRGYALAITGFVLAVCVTLALIRSDERVPFIAFLMPGQLYPASRSVDVPAAPQAEALTTLFQTPHTPTDPAKVDGSFDVADQNSLIGWAWDSTHPNDPIIVELEIDNVPAGCAIADKLRDDLAAAGIGNGRHGFFIKSPDILNDGNTHRVAIKILGIGKELASSPRSVGPG